LKTNITLNNNEMPKTCDIENFKMVAEHFNQDLKEFWNRANFYLVTNAGLFSAFLIVYPALVKDHLWIALEVPTLGIAIAVLWFFVLRGALHWIEQWRKQVIKLSKELDRFQCYYRVESSIKERKSLSPSYLTKFLPIAFITAWIMTLVMVLLEIL
jgi:hypothetical protein